MDTDINPDHSADNKQMIWDSIHAQRDFFKYHVPVARALGIPDAIFIGFIIFKQFNSDDPIELNVDEIRIGTALSYEQQRGIRKRLKAIGILEERVLRLQHKTFYRIDPAKLDKAVEAVPCELPAPDLGKVHVGTLLKSSSSIKGNNLRKEQNPVPSRNGPVGGHQSLIDQWHDCYKQQFGTPYVMHGGADGKAAKQLLTATKLLPNEIMRVVCAAWTKRGKEHWVCENKTHTLRDVASNWNRMLAEIDRPMPGQVPKDSVLQRLTKTPPEGLKPEMSRPTPGFNESGERISMEEWNQLYPLTGYYDENTFEPLGR